jgi:hypothetical protein
MAGDDPRRIAALAAIDVKIAKVRVVTSETLIA